MQVLAAALRAPREVGGTNDVTVSNRVIPDPLVNCISARGPPIGQLLITLFETVTSFVPPTLRGARSASFGLMQGLKSRMRGPSRPP